MLTTRNQENGFYGTVAASDLDITDLLWEQALNDVAIYCGDSEAAARDYLDSAYGRHYATWLLDNPGETYPWGENCPWLGRNVARFLRNYDPSNFGN